MRFWIDSNIKKWVGRGLKLTNERDEAIMDSGIMIYITPVTEDFATDRSLK